MLAFRVRLVVDMEDDGWDPRVAAAAAASRGGGGGATDGWGGQASHVLEENGWGLAPAAGCGGGG